MLYDGLTLAEGTSVANMTIASGTTTPSDPSTGELFYRTDSPNEGLYVYTGTEWTTVGATVDFDSLNVKPAVRAATTANITRSGEQTIDGVSLIAGQRVLVKNQNTGSENGIYVVSASTWTRATDFDGSPTTEVKSGDFVFVQEGTTNGDTGWVLTTNGTITIGTTALVFAQFTGSSAAALTSTYVGYGSGANQLSGEANFTWLETPKTLRLNTITSGNASLELRTNAGGVIGPRMSIGKTSAEMVLGVHGGNSQYWSFEGGVGDVAIINQGTGALLLGAGSGGAADYPALRLFPNGNSVFGITNSALATNSTNGFVYFPSMAGVPSGTPTAYTGKVPLVFDTTNNAAYFYSGGAWRSTTGQATSATNISGGAATQIPYQSATSTTAFDADFVWDDATRAMTLGATGTGANAFIQGAGGGGTLTLRGNGTANAGGTGQNIAIHGGNVASGSAAGGNLTLAGGTAGPSGGAGGYIALSTGATTTLTERFRILNNGAWSVGSTGTAYGTSGQVLTSNGNAAPTWQSTSFTGGTVANAITITAASPQLLLGTSGQAAGIRSVAGTTSFGITAESGTAAGCNISIAGGNSSSSAGGNVGVYGGQGGVGQVSGNATLQGGSNNVSGGTPGNAVVQAGQSNGGAAGHAQIFGGSVFAGSGIGGNVEIAGGVGLGGKDGGFVKVSTGATTTLTERFRILANGAWSVGTGGTAYGTSGQVLTSNGNAAPTWQAAPAPANISGGAINQIPFQSAASTTAFSADFTWSNSSRILALSASTQGGTVTITTGAGGTPRTLLIDAGNGNQGNTGSALSLKGGNGGGGTGSAGGEVTITGGTVLFGSFNAGAVTIAGGPNNVGSGGAGGAVNINGGSMTVSNQAGPGGDVALTAGNASLSGTASAGGNVTISGGRSAFKGGYISLSTAATTTATERVRVKENGAVRYVPMAQPASAEAGDVYYDSTSNKLRCYNGTIWNDLF